MATVRRRTRRATERVEFPISLDILLGLLDPRDVAEGDEWSVAERGARGIILRRDRETIETFDEDGELITPEPPEGEDPGPRRGGGNGNGGGRP